MVISGGDATDGEVDDVLSILVSKNNFFSLVLLYFLVLALQEVHWLEVTHVR